MKKNTLTWVALLLIGLLCFSFVACATSTENPEETSGEVTTAPNESNSSTETSDPTKDANGYELDSLPDDLNFKKTINILYWSDVEKPEFEVLVDTGDNVTTALIERNEATCRRLGIELSWTGEKGNNGNRANFATAVRTASGDRTYDIIATYSRSAGEVAIKNLYADLNAIDDSYLDLEKPWWPKSLLDTVVIEDRMFFISGDISTNTLHFMYGIFANIDMIESLHLEDPLDLVNKHTWTLDKMMAMAKNVYQDLDNSSSKTVDDVYGFAGIDYGLDAFYTGSGMTLINKDPDDVLVISPDYNSEKCYKLIEKLAGFIQTSDVCLSGANGASADWQTPFKEERCLFIQNRMYFAENHLRDVDLKYGVFPTPLWDEGQEDYITCIGNPFTLWGIAGDVPADELPMMTAVLECFASEAYRRTSPAIFEVNMKAKYTEEAKYAPMYDIIRNGLTFDLGRIFTPGPLGCYMSELPSKCAATNSSWASTYEMQIRSLKRNLQNNVVAQFTR